MTALSLRQTLAAALLCVITACASLPEHESPLRGVALEPDPTTRLGRHAAEFVGVHGPGVSGFAAIDANDEALRLRLAMIDSADPSDGAPANADRFLMKSLYRSSAARAVSSPPKVRFNCCR